MTDDVLDAALAHFDDLLLAGRFEQVDAELAAYDFAGCDLDLGVVVLMTTKPARDRLPSRAGAVATLQARLPTVEPYL